MAGGTTTRVEHILSVFDIGRVVGKLRGCNSRGHGEEIKQAGAKHRKNDERCQEPAHINHRTIIGLFLQSTQFTQPTCKMGAGLFSAAPVSLHAYSFLIR